MIWEALPIWHASTLRMHGWKVAGSSSYEGNLEGLGTVNLKRRLKGKYQDLCPPAEHLLGVVHDTQRI